MKKIRHSLRAKILVLFALVSVSMVTLFQIALGISHYYERTALVSGTRYYDAMAQASIILTDTLEVGMHYIQYLRTGDDAHLADLRLLQMEVRDGMLVLEQLLADDKRTKAMLLQEVQPGIDQLNAIINQDGNLADRQTSLERLQEWQEVFPSTVSHFHQQVALLYGQNRSDYVAITEIAYYALAATGVVVAAVYIVLGIRLSRGIMGPLTQLMQGIRAIAAGQYQQIHGVSSTDEVGELVLAFNKMVNAIAEAQADLESQNEELQAQSEELTAQNEEMLAQQDELEASIAKLAAQEETMKRLYGFSQRLTRTIELDELLRQVLEGLLAEADAQVGAILLYQPDTGELHARITCGMVSPDKLPVWTVGEGLLGRSAETRQLMVANFGEGQLRSQGLAGEWSMGSEIYLPLQFHGDLLGVAALGRTSRTMVEPDDQQRLMALADQAAVALDNALAHLKVRDALQQIQDVDRLKSELLNTVSHELRTPLASVLGFAELLLKKSPNEEKARQYLTTIHTEALRLTALINDFLDLQRIENGRLEFSMQQTDLAGIIRHSAGLYQGQSLIHSINVEIEDGLPMVWADPDRIAQVLGNLVGNAIKYSPGGGPIEIRAFRRSPAKVIVSVRDRGLGIPQEAIGQLFQPFFRVDNSDRREIGGTGLGLAICQKIIRAHGGEIWVESVHGQGSTFMISLPIATTSGISEARGLLGQRTANSRVSSEVAAARAAVGQPSVLVVEDDPAMLDLMTEALATEGYGLAVVDNGPEAIALAEQGRYAAVILDLTLNGSMDGWEVLRKLKERPLTSKVPVIICSSVDRRRQGLAMGAVEYLVKPFPPGRLVQVLTTVTAMPDGVVGMPSPRGHANAEQTLRELLESKGFEVREMISEKDVVIVSLAPLRCDERKVT